MHKDLKNKFIVVSDINNNSNKFIYMGRCFFHKELLERINVRNNTKFKCIGGGEFLIIKENNKINEIKFFGNSSDFGKYPLDIVKNLILNKKIFDTPFLNKSLFKKHNIKNIILEDYYYNCEKIKI